MTISYTVGDGRELVRGLADGSVDLVTCSPPFLALRSYLAADHPGKAAEIGSEATPAEFLDTLLELTAEWGRVLTPTGSIAIELGDTYSGSGGAGGDYNEQGLRDGQPKFSGSALSYRRSAVRNRQLTYGVGAAPRPPRNGRMASGAQDAPQNEDGAEPGHKYARVDSGHGHPIRNLNDKVQPGGPGWPLAKCLTVIPQLYQVALAYGLNPLTGRPSPAGRWRLRNVVVWHRPNPTVGALGDKFRPSTSYITVATRDKRRWFDLTAVRTVALDQRHRNTNGPKQIAGDPAEVMTANYHQRVPSNPAGAPPLDTWLDEHDGHDTWTMSTSPSSLAHYAMWPPKLAERLVLSMCPGEVCTVCGEPRRRLEEDNPELAAAKAAVGDKWTSGGTEKGNKRPKGADRIDVPGHKLTVGWSDCGHGSYRPGVVLDPFAGTGTTLCVAELHGRDSLGFDLNPENERLLQARMGECRRALFDSPPADPNQLDLFAEGGV